MHTAISKTDSKDLLHNIENSTQYFIRTYMGKNLNIYVCMYVCVYVCVCVCVCNTPETNTNIVNQLFSI